MAEFEAGFEGVDEGVEDFGDGQDFDTGVDADFEGTESEEFADEVEDNPWSWAEGLDPSAIQKTWSNFTQNQQELMREKSELEPYRELYKELTEDAALQEVIRNYYATGQPSDKKIQNLEAELRTMQTEFKVREEFSDLKKYVEQHDLPDFKEEDLMQYAIDNNILSMKTAYRDMMFEKAQEAANDKLTKDIKKSKGAALPKSGRGEGNLKPTRPSTADIANMSEDDFVSGYGGLVKGLVGK